MHPPASPTYSAGAPTSRYAPNATGLNNNHSNNSNNYHNSNNGLYGRLPPPPPYPPPASPGGSRSPQGAQPTHHQQHPYRPAAHPRAADLINPHGHATSHAPTATNNNNNTSSAPPASPQPAKSAAKPRFSTADALAATAGYLDNTKTIIEGADTAWRFWDDHLAQWVVKKEKKKKEEKSDGGELDGDDGQKEGGVVGEKDNGEHHHHHRHVGNGNGNGNAVPSEAAAAAAAGRSPNTASPGAGAGSDDQHDSSHYYHDDSDSDQADPHYYCTPDNNTTDEYDDEYNEYESDPSPPEPFRVGDRVRFVEGSAGLHGNKGPFEVCRADAAADVYDVRFPPGPAGHVVGWGIEGDELDFVGFGAGHED
ncbi:uncharacterized protein BKCO1_4000124 [Diplodia corticola]|uniref:Uncharacterized protein n=1 Tax=Diplodia corticola TaxID=236234 RepID=A0A1J9SGT0_9PEZI|nr:uncharacterized protein BKCO1_4000124 [Diplodia corticola]OJD38789.1 hypothetical protein BKCO1_4000124 [Diplodia corticola]